MEIFFFHRLKWIDFSRALLAFEPWILQEFYAMMPQKR